jgi:hypothetical protein
MSASAITLAKKQTSLAPQALPDLEPGEVLKGQGGNGWFNGISNDQVDWPMAYGEELAVPPTIYRMQAWLLHHTVTKGHRHSYANKGGSELHIENLAADLDIELHNCRTYWRQGAEMGLWRYGTEKEGSRRLYPCARIKPAAKQTEDSETRGMYKPLPDIFQNVKSYIREHLETLPPERLMDAARRYARLKLLRDTALAEAVSTVRMVTDTIEDTLWREIGVEKKRLNGTSGAKAKEVSPEEAAETAERQKRVDALFPHIQGYVQTLDAFVQSPEIEAYKPPIGDVQTPSGNGISRGNGHKSNGNGSVAGIEKTALPYPGLDTTKSKRESVRSRQRSDSTAPPVSKEPLPEVGRSSYTGSGEESATAAPAKLAEHEQAALKLLAEQIEHMKTAYKHTDFGLSEFDPISKPGQLFLYRVMTEIGGSEKVMSFCLTVAAKFKGLDRHAMGKLPARAPGQTNGPRGIGLLLEWAKDFGRRGGVR